MELAESAPGIRVAEDVRIPVGDAGYLAGTLYLPVGPGPFPALVTVVPYRRDTAAGLFYGPYLRWFAAHGYASLLADFRGTGGSGGRQRPPFDPEEGDDGVAAVEWAASEPWSTGKVGMWGHSYGAIMSMRTAERRPPHLAAIAPVMGMLDPERDFVHPGGVRGCLGSVASWGLQTLATQLVPPLSDGGLPTDLARWQQRVDEDEPWLLDLIRRSPGDPAWRPRAITPSAIRVPSFVVAGWRDLFCDASVRAYEQISAPKQLLVGPWLHTMPDAAGTEPVDFRTLALRWWDRWLGDADLEASDDPPVTLYIQGDPKPWRQYRSWPPSAEAAGYTTNGDTALTAVTAPAGTVRPVRQPADRAIAEQYGDPTVGSLGGLWSMPSPGFGYPLDQHDDDLRSICCTSEPFQQEILVAGRPQVTVALTGQAPARLVARLTDVDENGRSTLISAGVAPSPQAPRAGLTQDIELGPTAYRLRRGHRLRVVLGDADFPRLWPAPEARVLSVAAVQVSLPTVALDEGQEAQFPQPAGRPRADVSGDPGAPAPGCLRPAWTITRDPLGRSITVTLGADLQAVTPAGAAYQEKRTVSASTGCSGATQVHGTQTIVVTPPTGEPLTVEAELLLADWVFRIEASVRIGVATMVTRTWDGRAW